MLSPSSVDKVGQFDQILRHRRTASPIEQFGAGHQQHARLTKRAHDQRGVGIEFGAYANGNVIAFADHVDAAVAGEQAYLHLRIARHKLRQHVRQNRTTERHRAAHPHHASRLGLQFVHRLLRGLRFFQHGAAVAVEALADLGHHEAARRTLQQAHAKALLQLRNTLGQARFGNTQRSSGGGKATVFNHSGEEIQIVEILQGTGLSLHGVSFGERYVSIKPANQVTVQILDLTPWSITAGYMQERIMKLLHIDSSSLGQASVSRQLSEAVTRAWQDRHTELEVTYRDLVAERQPHWAPGDALSREPDNWARCCWMSFCRPMWW